MVLPPSSSTPGPLRPSRELLTAWLLLLVKAGVTYGYDMRRALAARNLEVEYASVYRMLRKLQRDGQLRSTWGKTVAGPRRRLYEITPAGRRTLADIAERLTLISQTHHTFLKTYAQTPDEVDASATGIDPAPAAADDVAVGLLALDHVALAVADPEAMAAFLCDHVGMHELARGDDALLVGAAALGTNLRLIAAEGPREPGALARLLLRVSDLQRALDGLPADVEVQQDGPGQVTFAGPEGLGLGFTLGARGLDYDLDHLILRVAYPQEATVALIELGCLPLDGGLQVADKRITLEELPAWTQRPLLDHITLRVASVEQIAAQARQSGLETADAAGDDSVTVVLPGLERIRLTFVKLDLAE